MSNDFYNNDVGTLAFGEIAKAVTVEAKFDEVVTGFAKLPDQTKLNRGTVNFVDDSGAADAYVVSMAQTASALTDGMQVDVRITTGNTGACTINVDSLGAKSIKKANGTNPGSGDIGDGDIVSLRYDSDNGYFVIQSVTRDVVNASVSEGVLSENWLRKTANFTTSINGKYSVDSGLTVTLNGSPVGDEYVKLSPLGDMTSSAATIARNGNTLMGLSENMTWDINDSFALKFDSTTSDWRLA